MHIYNIKRYFQETIPRSLQFFLFRIFNDDIRNEKIT